MFDKFEKIVTDINHVTARAASLLIYPLVLVILAEAFVRHFFQSMLFFAYDFGWMSFTIIAFVAGGYALKNDVHVKADILYNVMPKRVKKIVTIFCYVFFFFIPVGVVVYYNFRALYIAIIIGEFGQFTPWAPPMWPIRTIMCFGFLMLFLQGIVKFREFLKKDGGEGIC